MPNITLSVPAALYQDMKRYPEIRWSEVARQAIEKRVAMLRMMDEALKESELTEAQAIQLGKEVNRKMGEYYKSKFRGRRS